MPLQEKSFQEQEKIIIDSWKTLDECQRFVLNKLITGGLRVGVSRQLVGRALALKSGQSTGVIAHRLMGPWHPSAANFSNLISAEQSGIDQSKPYPFYLASPLEVMPVDPNNSGTVVDSLIASLGLAENWYAEWKWDGIRAQIIKRQGEIFIWSRGEELVTDRYPEVV